MADSKVHAFLEGYGRSKALPISNPALSPLSSSSLDSSSSAKRGAFDDSPTEPVDAPLPPTLTVPTGRPPKSHSRIRSNSMHIVSSHTLKTIMEPFPTPERSNNSMASVDESSAMSTDSATTAVTGDEPDTTSVTTAAAAVSKTSPLPSPLPSLQTERRLRPAIDRKRASAPYTKSPVLKNQEEDDDEEGEENRTSTFNSLVAGRHSKKTSFTDAIAEDAEFQATSPLVPPQKDSFQETVDEEDDASQLMTPFSLAERNRANEVAEEVKKELRRHQTVADIEGAVGVGGGGKGSFRHTKSNSLPAPQSSSLKDFVGSSSSFSTIPSEMGK